MRVSSLVTLKKMLYLLSCVVILAGACPGPAFSSESKAGEFLTRRGTELLLDGKPFRAVSVNKFDLFLQCLQGEDEKKKALESIRDIGRRGFRVIRFGAVGFYPRDMDLWPQGDKYWKCMDELIAAARESGVRLVPVIMWNWYLFPDMANETMQDMLTNKDSRSRQYVDLYVSQIVGRYKNEPTILFWDIWSELNLGADLEFMRPYGFSDLNDVNHGSAAMRVRRDNYTTQQMIPFMRDLARLIRKIDPNHPISSGNSAPRPVAQHLRLKEGKGDWTQDTPEEAETYMRDVHPDPIDILSIHFYPGIDNLRFGNSDKDSAVALRTLKQIADRIGKPVIIGESGGEGFQELNGKCSPFTQSLIKEAVAADYPVILYWMEGMSNPLAFDLDKTPALNKLLLDAGRQLTRKARNPR
ncbi:MAG: glycoside hydrolase family 5 protein [Armatimonadetes bacterium]|nr:glycoside hydrolase family 5 protein [Armatimonadota bacterium]